MAFSRHVAVGNVAMHMIEIGIPLKYTQKCVELLRRLDMEKLKEKIGENIVKEDVVELITVSSESKEDDDIESETRVSSCFPDESAATGDVKTVVAPLTSEKETKANVISHRRNDEVKTGESPKPDSACDSMTSIQGGALDASESHCGHPPPVTSDTHSETKGDPLTSSPRRARSVKDLQALCEHPPVQSSVLDCIFRIPDGTPPSRKDYSFIYEDIHQII